MTVGELLDVVAERIRKDKLAQAGYVDGKVSRIAHVTLDSLAHNIALEIVGRDKSMSDVARRFMDACGPWYSKRST